MIIRVKSLPLGYSGVCICKGLLIITKDAPDSLIAYEQVHENEWSIKWLVKYLISPVFRMKAEVCAYTMQAEMEYVPVTKYYTTIRDRYLLTNKAKSLLAELMWESA